MLLTLNSRQVAAIRQLADPRHDIATVEYCLLLEELAALLPPEPLKVGDRVLWAPSVGRHPTTFGTLFADDPDPEFVWVRWDNDPSAAYRRLRKNVEGA